MCQRNNNIFNNKEVINISKLRFIFSSVIKMMIFTNFAIFITDEKINVNFKIFITSFVIENINISLKHLKGSFLCRIEPDYQIFPNF